jgi:hypothetical protein
VTPFPVNVIPPVIVTGIIYSFCYWIPDEAAKFDEPVNNAPLDVAAAVSVEYVIRYTVVK